MVSVESVRATVLIAGFVVFVFVNTGAAAPRLWTDITGKFQYEAELVAIDAGVVKLRLESGKTASIPLDKLSKADQALIAELGDPGTLLEIKTSPEARIPVGAVEDFTELLKRSDEVGQRQGREGLGKLHLKSADPVKQAEGIKLLVGIKELGDSNAWDEASAAIARHYSAQSQWAKAEEAWFDYISDKTTGRFGAEAWYSLGRAREEQAGADKEKLAKANMAYVFCFVKYQSQVRYSAAAFRHAAEVEYRRGEKEKAFALTEAMLLELGGLSKITAPKDRTADIKLAQEELKKVNALRDRWAKEPD